ncbi:hypothetical protein FAZ19_22305 [Sphingobacterium alkalisoli]|uniref:Outer membrane protein beta-barrel domain-containing protein n=1 Tax=Sphingobacterium alkalisoli TaxID=1874115 RepID=A0A4U0GSB9_9SPHI|nr:hypothetical protein [Sphingobacterium alkalisoli]TJY61354.1 hypothetical protein FAZ19_22305 [Sphingobacterium alkalisoli]GGH30774.1 hypothetical protein GCM10011418_43100 [Sphingobacterium alkalisoli]
MNKLYMNKPMKTSGVAIRLLFVLFAVLGISIGNAAAADGDRDTIPESDYDYGYPFRAGLGVHAGINGVGAHYYQPLGTKFGFRLGASFMPFHTDIQGTYSGRATRSRIEAQAHNASLTFGWAPFVGSRNFFRSFNVQLGGAYFFKLEGELATRLADPYQYGDIAVDPEDVGEIFTDVEWKKTVNPYAGIGWSNIVLDSRFSLSLDFGCYYLSEPSVSMSATGLLEESAHNNNRNAIEQNIRNYRYLPRIEFGVSYRLR